MKNIAYLILLFLLTSISGCKGENSQLNISLEFIDRSYVNVEISNISTNQDSILLIFPKSKSGTYHSIPNQVYDFKAYTSDGEPISITVNDYKYLINSGKDLSIINYKVKSSDYSSINILSFGNIYEKDLLVLNNNTLFCKFPCTSLQYNVRIKKREGFKNISNLKVVEENDSTDLIMFSDFQQLISSPIIYSSNNNSDSILINDKRIIINVHNSQNKIDASYLSKVLKTTIQGTIKEIDFTFEDNYILTFIYNEKVKKNIFKEIALEHTNSSIYHFFSEPYFFTIQDSIEFTTDLQHMVAHELFHVFTPISFSDNLVNDFYSEKLRMSSHLWMYEGFVEYQSLKILLKNNIIDFETFTSKIEKKIYNYSRFEKMRYYTSLAELSENIYNKHHLATFYNRAAVLCFLMDIEVIELSKGRYDLFSVFKEMFNNSPSFHKDSLFVEMNKIVPGIDSFINRYIIDDKYPDVSSHISNAGLKYSKTIKTYGYYYPFKILSDSSNNQSALIAFSENILPFKKNDTIRLIEINEIPVNSYSFSLIYRRYFNAQKTFNIKYKLNEEIVSIDLKSIPVRVPKVPFYPSLSLMTNLSDSQQRVFNKLFEKN